MLVVYIDFPEEKEGGGMEMRSKRGEEERKGRKREKKGVKEKEGKEERGEKRKINHRTKTVFMKLT